jgi:hypothetical protein
VAVAVPRTVWDVVGPILYDVLESALAAVIDTRLHAMMAQVGPKQLYVFRA